MADQDVGALGAEVVQQIAQVLGERVQPARDPGRGGGAAAEAAAVVHHRGRDIGERGLDGGPVRASGGEPALEDHGGYGLRSGRARQPLVVQLPPVAGARDPRFALAVGGGDGSAASRPVLCRTHSRASRTHSVVDAPPGVK
ncbi:hypothetical protein SMICM304S_11621 [Streptomyces microflavus]